MIDSTQTAFVVRRAFRFGETRRSDVMDAFGLSSASATRVMTAARRTYQDVLEYREKRLVPRPGAQPPIEASEADLIEQLDTGVEQFARTGLRESELRVTLVRWTNPLPVESGALMRLVRAIAAERAVRLHYAGLRRGEDAKWRLVAPLGLERMGDQWQLIASDLEATHYPEKVFVLARILSVIDEQKRPPRGFIWKYPSNKMIACRVDLNKVLMPSQMRAVGNEMRLIDGTVRIHERSLYEFRRRFAEVEQIPDIAWPLAYRVEVQP